MTLAVLVGIIALARAFREKGPYERFGKEAPAYDTGDIS